MLLAGLLSFAPSLFSGLFGDPQKKLRQQLGQLSSPGYAANLTNQNYQQALGSPAFSQAQGNIAAGANAAQGQLASSLGARGIGTTGTASIMSSAIPSMIGGQQAGLRTSAYQGAQSQAQNQIQQQIQALLGTSGPSQSQQLFGTGLESFLPFLMQMLGGQKSGTARQVVPYGAKSQDYAELLRYRPLGG